MTGDSPLLKDWSDSPTTIRYTSERHIDLRLIQHQLDEIEDVLIQTLRYPTFADHLPLDRLLIMKQRYESALDTLIAIKLSFGMRSVFEPREEKPSAIIEQRMKQSYDFILDVLRLFSLDETDSYHMLFWRCEEPGSFEFFVRCNDLFWWATADLEQFTAEDLPAMRQAVADVRTITGQDLFMPEAFELWVARKRKMRPQQPAYPKDERLRALFDACGPERDPKDEG